MEVLWNMTGGVTDTSAVVSAKLPYAYGTPVNSPKVYTLVFDETNLSVYCNNVLVQTVENTGHCRYLNDIYFGADYDDTCYFKGIFPNIIFWNGALNSTDITNFNNWMGDKWLPAGTVMGSHTTTGSLTTKPTVGTSGVAAFLDFDETGLAISGGRITSWTDSTTLGTRRVSTPKSGTTMGITSINGLNALTFDTETYMKIPLLDNSANGPNPITVMFVAQFNNFDTNQWAGDTDQTLLSTGSNTAIRIKKFDADSYLDFRFGTDTSGYSTIDIPKTTIIPSTFTPADLGSVQVKIGTSVGNRLPYGSPITVNSGTTFGMARIPITGLTPNTQYFCIFTINGVEDAASAFTFKTTFTGAKSFKIIAGSCNRTASTADTWRQILTENADAVVHLGDLHYLDIDSSNEQDFAQGTDTTMTSPQLLNFFRNTAVNYIYDNHDSLGVNPNVTFADWPQFIDYWTKAFPYHTLGSNTPTADGCYYAFTIGRARCIVTENRSHRNAITDPDNSSKTTLGTVQKQWVKDQLLAAKNDNTIEQILFFSPILWLADKNNPYGNSFQSPGMSWANYATERSELADYIYNNQIPNVVFICGDTHMQCIDDGRNACYITGQTYNSINPKFVTPVLEASPFDQYTDVEGGPFQINDAPDSGGPYPSYEQAYGIIEVLDTGTNWLQTTLSLKALVNGIWVVLYSYTFNSPCNLGTPTSAPIIDYNADVNANGYVGKSGNWDKVINRSIGINGQWKPQLYKFVGKNGYWEKIFSSQPVTDASPIVIYDLNGYTANSSNVITITGKGFQSSQYPQPQVGGYFELSKNSSDIFGNISTGTLTGSPLFASVAGVNALHINAVGQYFSLANPGLNAIDLVGDGTKDFFLGVLVYMPGLPADKYWLWKYSDGTNFLGVYIDSNGKINVTTNTSIITSTTAIAAATWNSVALNIKGVDNSYSKLYVNGNIDTVSVATLVISAPTGTPSISFGADAGAAYSSAPDLSIANIYVVDRYVQDALAAKYAAKPQPQIVLVRNSSGTETAIPSEWRFSPKTDTGFDFTVPLGFASDDYSVYVKSLDFKSVKLPLSIVDFTKRTTPLVIDFSTPQNLNDNFYLLNHGWGGANGGVVAANVYQQNGLLVLESHGDNYTGNIQGVDTLGNPKLHTDPSDPKVNQTWTNRVGACIVSKEYLGYGSYEVVAKLPPLLGVASAFWTFHYEEIYPGDPRYATFQSEGLHEQGEVNNGFYITRNHEIDIEFPSQLTGQDYTQANLSNFKGNAWRGELQNWGVAPTDPAYWQEYQSNLTAVGSNMGDGNFHKFRFDWHSDRVDFYIDDVLKTTITNGSTGNVVPDIPGRFTLGCWFPSSPLAAKSWLTDPAKGWAGGILDTDGGLKANWDSQQMYIQKITFAPFIETGERLIGETYPFGGLRVQGGN